MKSLLTTLILLVGLSTYGQVWRLGGNINTGIDGLTSFAGNNEFGSIANTDITLKQNDLERIKLSNGAWADPVLGLQNATRIGVSINDGVSPFLGSHYDIQ